MLLSPHVNKLRTNCSNCILLANGVSVADIANLIVLKSNNQWSLSIDLHVYNKSQQSRLYDAAKAGLNNPLITASDYLLESTTSHCYFDILHRSLLTNINKQHNSLPTVNEKYFKELNYKSKDIENN